MIYVISFHIFLFIIILKLPSEKPFLSLTLNHNRRHRSLLTVAGCHRVKARHTISHQTPSLSTENFLSCKGAWCPPCGEIRSWGELCAAPCLPGACCHQAPPLRLGTNGQNRLTAHFQRQIQRGAAAHRALAQLISGAVLQQTPLATNIKQRPLDFCREHGEEEVVHNFKTKFPGL